MWSRGPGEGAAAEGSHNSRRRGPGEGVLAVAFLRGAGRAEAEGRSYLYLICFLLA